MVQQSDYRKTGLVGEGQFGKVYGAIHRYTGELVALKELNPQQISTKQFLREIRILLTLQHPHIMSCYGIKHEQKKRYLITEYCEGGTLRDLLNTNSYLTIEHKLKIIIDILDALNYIHAEGIIHRDLKPENILLSLTTQGWVGKISDFGVAKIPAEDMNPNSSTMGDTGSPAYMAPEQFYGKYSYSSDIYAMGIILWEILTGDRPFMGSPAEIMQGHLNKTPQIPEDIPDGLEAILLKALAKLPQNRFLTAAQMKAEILKATLNLSEYNEFLYTQVPSKLIDYNLIESQNISSKIKFIAIDDDYLYQATEKSLIIDFFNVEEETKRISLQHQNTLELENKVVDLQAVNNGCVLTTQSEEKDNQYSLLHFQDKLTKLIDWHSDFLAYAYSHNLTWFAVNQSHLLEQGFQLVNLTNQSSIRSLIIDFIPEQIISIDKNHGVVIYTQKSVNSQETYFRFFNRRGDWYYTYNVPLLIDKVVDHPLLLNTFITREKRTNYLLLIKFEPFSIRRFPLSFRADFILPTKSGFICASEQGNIAFLDLSGNYLGEINFNYFIVAIAPFDTDKFVVISEQQGQKTRQLYHINLSAQETEAD